MTTRSCLRYAVVIVAVQLLVGCSGNAGSGDYATLSGVVKYKGKPIEEAKVQFESTTESDGGRTGFAAYTNEKGEYSVVSVGNSPGIPPGTYKVVVTKLVVKEGFQPPEEGWDMVQLEESGLGRNALPSKYADFKTSNLEVTLKKGENTENFNLK